MITSNVWSPQIVCNFSEIIYIQNNSLSQPNIYYHDTAVCKYICNENYLKRSQKYGILTVSFNLHCHTINIFLSNRRSTKWNTRQYFRNDLRIIIYLTISWFLHRCYTASTVFRMYIKMYAHMHIYIYVWAYSRVSVLYWVLFNDS